MLKHFFPLTENIKSPRTPYSTFLYSAAMGLGLNSRNKQQSTFLRNNEIDRVVIGTRKQFT